MKTTIHLSLPFTVNIRREIWCENDDAHQLEGHPTKEYRYIPDLADFDGRRVEMFGHRRSFTSEKEALRFGCKYLREYAERIKELHQVA